MLLLNLLDQKKSNIETVDLAVISYSDFAGFSDFQPLQFGLIGFTLCMRKAGFSFCYFFSYKYFNMESLLCIKVLVRNRG